jgi:sec-independent protein translocase protein TatA
MNLGVGEIALLIVLALVLFGAKRLPEVGRAAGSAIREFKSAMNGAEPKEGEPLKAEPRSDENA